jgi:predicted dithiol-disulfide oxidoreductase (DUF899 family)
MNMPPIVSPHAWDAARQELLVKEKELTRARDALAAERRRMPHAACRMPHAACRMPHAANDGGEGLPL